jgi:hypothetical protein
MSLSVWQFVYTISNARFDQQLGTFIDSIINLKLEDEGADARVWGHVQ